METTTLINTVALDMMQEGLRNGIFATKTTEAGIEFSLINSPITVLIPHHYMMEAILYKVYERTDINRD